MAFCASCGAEVQGNFCGKCGAPSGSPASASTSSAPGNSAPGPGPTAGLSSAAPAVLEENVAAALCYLVGVLTGILALVIEPYNRNPVVRFHAFQSIFAWVAAMVIGMAVSMLSYPIAALPFIGWLIDILLWLAFSLGVLVLWLFLMYKAYNKERFVLPVIGIWAEKQAHSSAPQPFECSSAVHSRVSSLPPQACMRRICGSMFSTFTASVKFPNPRSAKLWESAKATGCRLPRATPRPN